MKKQRQPYSVSRDLNAFVVRITKEWATFESASKNWKVAYRSDTDSAMYIIKLFEVAAWKELEYIANLLYRLSDSCVTNSHLSEVLSAVIDKANELRARDVAEVSDEEHAEILEQERRKHEYQETLKERNADTEN